MDKYQMVPAASDTDKEAAYLASLNKWALRVKEWNRTHNGKPPILVDQEGNAHWINRKQRRSMR